MLWQYANLNQEEPRSKGRAFQETYGIDLSEEPVDAMDPLKAIHETNLGPVHLAPLQC